jgi:hypothetical protein
MASRVQLTAYVPSEHLPLLGTHIAACTVVAGNGVWRHRLEPVCVLTLVTSQTAAEEIAAFIHARLTSAGEQEVLITIHPVTVWSPQ